jgi:hypothetical protein
MKEKRMLLMCTHAIQALTEHEHAVCVSIHLNNECLVEFKLSGLCWTQCLQAILALCFRAIVLLLCGRNFLVVDDFCWPYFLARDELF